MDEQHLYERIAASIRQQILEGQLQPGARLPSIRNLMQTWNCTAGTVQRAYQELARQGLVVSLAGKGTHVAHSLSQDRLRGSVPLRRANMVHRAEALLLESITAGFSLEEIQQSFSLALDRWRSLVRDETPPLTPLLVRFAGSHDMAVAWLSEHIGDFLPGLNLALFFTGSLGGLMALAEGKAELAGCHLLDMQSGTYNEPYVRKLFPGQRMTLTRLAGRRIGLMLAPGNPLAVQGVADLVKPGLRFVNRQAGSGTRVWLDAQLQQVGLQPVAIQGYAVEKNTHSESARAVAEGEADAALGLESAAAAYGLDFIPQVDEKYDLVTYTRLAVQEPLRGLLAWLATPAARTALGYLRGYDLSETGQQREIIC